MISWHQWRDEVADLALDAAPLAPFDTETTGFDPYGPSEDRLVSICILHGALQDIEPEVALQAYIDPERDIPAAATRVHGITNDGMQSARLTGVAVPFRQRAAEVVDAFRGRIPVAHNLPFDAKFLRQGFGRGAPGRDWVPRGIDTVALAWAAWPHADNHKLATCCELVGHDLTNAHEARADAEACFAVVKGAVWALRGQGHELRTVGHLLRAQLKGLEHRRTARGF